MLEMLKAVMRGFVTLNSLSSRVSIPATSLADYLTLVSNTSNLRTTAACSHLEKTLVLSFTVE